MSDIAISVRNLSKLYRLGAARKPYKTFRESLTEVFNKKKSSVSTDLWALKDVSFDIKKGEVFGVIGRNGAGKSTLLKILSRIAEPSEGEIDLYGRVGSLLEVGTGFHPELTGRENIYLNGAILGMKRLEINKKFDEIIAFAELEKFLDTPVKHYSSGMYMRLAFAVAAHMDTEILLVDEVLAVGDAEFQKKCLGKMSDVAKTGRTVLFVSHNLSAIQQLCAKVIFLEKGQVKVVDDSASVIQKYLSEASFEEAGARQEKKCPEGLIFKYLDYYQNGMKVTEILDQNLPFEVRLGYQLTKQLPGFLAGFDLFAADGVHLFRSYDFWGNELKLREPGIYESVCVFPASFFQPSSYSLSLIFGIHRVKWIVYETHRYKVNFSGPKVYDVTFSGELQPVGKWAVRRLDS